MDEDDEDERRITAVEANRNFGRVQEEAARRPVVITHHGRPRFAILSYEAYRDLCSKDDDGIAAAEAAAAQRRKLLLILDSMSEAYISFDADWRFRTLNRAGEFFLGRSREELSGRALTEIFPGLNGSEAEAYLRRAMESGEFVTFPWSSVVRRGRRLQVRAFPLPLDEGGIGVLFSNVGDQDRLEARVRELEARLEALAREEPNGALIALDDDGVVVEWTAEAEAMLGWSAAERLGLSIETIFSAGDREAGRLWSEMATARRRGRAEATAELETKAGAKVLVKDVLLRLADPAAGFLKIVRARS